MAEYAPPAIHHLFDAIDAALGGAAKLSGILGDAAHTYGYHRARNVLPSSDYSVKLALDRHGDGWAASALDIGLDPAHMKLVTSRLLDHRHDRRLAALREFYGTVDGKQVTGWDFPSNTHASSDDSHLWHVHLSIFRAYATNWTALAPVVDVIAGKPEPRRSTSSGTHKTLPTAPRWPLPAGHYFGLISGGNKSHGGFYAQEKPLVRKVQLRLQALGFAPKVNGWADGIYGQETVNAVTAWQRAKWRKQTTRFGEVWADDWKHLFG